MTPQPPLAQRAGRRRLAALLAAGTVACSLALTGPAATADDTETTSLEATSLEGTTAPAPSSPPAAAPAPAPGPLADTAAEASADAEQVATVTTVAPPAVANRAIYLLGHEAPLAATVSVPAAAPGGTEPPAPGLPAGTVEFFDGETSLGSAPLVDEGGAALARLTSDRWPASGARAIVAVFTPEPDSPWAASTSAPQTYRIIDTARMVSDVALGSDIVADISGASLDWTIANIWFSNFSVGFEREVVSGNVSLEDIPVGTTIPERQAHYFRPFTFTAGTGQRDAAGNRVIDFTGTARLTSGTGNQWNFTDPRIHIGANGDGYLTAEFSGFYAIGVHQEYEPTRVTIATFSGAQLESTEAGVASAEIPLNWAGQAGGAGTWASDYRDSFPNEFVSLLNPGISLFFARSSVATDASKVPHPITVSFAEQAVETPGPGEGEEPGSGGTDEGTGGGTDGGTGEVPSTATPGGGTATPPAATDAAGARTGTSRLSETGASAPLQGIALAAAAAAMLAGGLLLRHRVRRSALDAAEQAPGSGVR